MIGRLYQPSVHLDQRLRGGGDDDSAVGVTCGNKLRRLVPPAGSIPNLLPSGPPANRGRTVSWVICHCLCTAEVG
jgi:hypothetical protein